MVIRLPNNTTPTFQYESDYYDNREENLLWNKEYIKKRIIDEESDK